MINHIQTLLLNESASVVQSALEVKDYGYIDPSFVKLPLDSAISAAYASIFPDDRTIAWRLSRVKRLLPFFHTPEFASYLALFDTREILASVKPTGIFGFYGSMTADAIPISIVMSSSTPNAFLPTETPSLNTPLNALHVVYSESKETAHCFSAFLFALAIHLESARLRVLDNTVV